MAPWAGRLRRQLEYRDVVLAVVADQLGGVRAPADGRGDLSAP